jgi:GNAT superfamily N-acetyltransferase
MHQPQTFAWGGQRYRYGAWHAEDGTAFLAPEHTAGPPSAAVLRRLLDQLSDLGFAAVVTSALNESVTPTFLSVGFQRIDELAVLRHDLATIVDAPDVDHHRGTTKDRTAVLELDALAFQPAWRLDGVGLDDAIHATRAARWRVVDAPHTVGNAAIAYAVSGRSGRAGFLQRLAVHPEHLRHGLGRALVADCLKWNRRWASRSVLVNTQKSNEAALALYRDCGFERTQPDLHVLRTELR